MGRKKYCINESLSSKRRIVPKRDGTDRNGKGREDGNWNSMANRCRQRRNLLFVGCWEGKKMEGKGITPSLICLICAVGYLYFRTFPLSTTNSDPSLYLYILVLFILVGCVMNWMKCRPWCSYQGNPSSFFLLSFFLNPVDHIARIFLKPRYSICFHLVL